MRLKLNWWIFREALASRRVRHHRIELTTWIVQRDMYRQRIKREMADYDVKFTEDGLRREP